MEQESGGKSVIRHVMKNWMLGRREKVAMAQSALRHEARWVYSVYTVMAGDSTLRVPV